MCRTVFCLTVYTKLFVSMAHHQMLRHGCNLQQNKGHRNFPKKELSFTIKIFTCTHTSFLKFLLKISLCSSQDYQWYFSIKDKLNALGTSGPKTYNNLMVLVTTKKTKIEYWHDVSLFFFPNNFPFLHSTQTQFWFISFLWAQNQSVTKTGYIT